MVVVECPSTVVMVTNHIRFRRSENAAGQSIRTIRDGRLGGEVRMGSIHLMKHAAVHGYPQISMSLYFASPGGIEDTRRNW